MSGRVSACLRLLVRHWAWLWPLLDVALWLYVVLAEGRCA